MSRPRRRLLRRLRRSPATWWGAASVAALAAGVVVWSALAGVRAELDRVRHEPVTVVSRHVAAGDPLGPGDLATASWPATAVPPGVASAVAIGRAAAVDLHPGEPLLEARLAPAGAAGLAARLPPGARAVGIPVGPHTVPLARGDRVDLVAPRAPRVPTDLPGAAVLTAAVPVLDVRDAAVVVAVPATDVPAVVGAIAIGPVEVVITP